MRKLKITTENESEKPKRLSKKQLQEMSLIGHVEKIVEQSKNSKLSTEFYKNVKHHAKYIGDKLALTPVQSVLVSLFINNSDDRRIGLKDLSNFVDCAHITMIGLMNDIDVLIAKKYIRSRQDDDSFLFSVPKEFVEAVRKEIPYTPSQFTNLDKDSVFISIEKIIKLREDGECSHQAFIDDLTYLIKNNQQVTFCKRMAEYLPDEENLIVLTTFCSLLVNEDDNRIGFHDFIDLFECEYDKRRIKRAMQQGNHPLMKDGLGLIECLNDDGLENHEYYKLTKKAREELLAEYELKDSETKPQKEFILHTALAKKELFYNSKEMVQIKQLGSLLQNDNFSKVQQRLEEGGLRKGFACLFYGSPGTGKTETVYQIAKQTGRDIMEVNVAQIKSCWVGESEKNIKALFVRYREFCNTAEVMPILLFNEADAVIGIRQEAAQRAVDKMENSIQNIILQEMEVLDGIMIATTNLTQNLDKAFERRFLYKIEFTKPSIEAKQSIWRSMMPALSMHEATELAGAYDFSGGQIENITRKRAIDAIISGTAPTMETLHSYCKSEQLYKTVERKRIGF